MPDPATILVKPHLDEYVQVAQDFALPLMVGEILVLPFAGEQKLSEHISTIKKERAVHGVLLGSDVGIAQKDIDVLKRRLKTIIFRPVKYEKMKSFLAYRHGGPQSPPKRGGDPWGLGTYLVAVGEARHMAVTKAILCGLGFEKGQFRIVPIPNGGSLQNVEKAMSLYDTGSFVIVHHNAGSLSIKKYAVDGRKIWKDPNPVKALRKFYSDLKAEAFCAETPACEPH